jgi:predicted transcriptional regulator
MTSTHSTERGETVSIRLPADLRASLERLARDQDRTLSSQIRFLVCQALLNKQRQVLAA